MGRPRKEIISEMVDSGLFSDDEIRSAANGASQSQSSGFMDTVGSAMSKIGQSMPLVAGAISPGYGLAVDYLTRQAPQQSEELGGAVAEYAGKQGANPYVGAGLGMAASIASNPLTYAPAPKIDFALKPAKGTPSISARIKQMRTGVEAKAFDQLRRDPGAFINRTPRDVAGKAIGRAKEEAGVNLGVTGDIKSLTPENLSLARNPVGVASRAQDKIASDLETAVELLGPNASPKEIIGLAKITPDDASKALDGINIKLNRLERSEGAGGKNFQKWSTVKSHVQSILDEVAPGVREANKDFSRVALRDKLMQPFPMNQNTAFSKINAFGFAPAIGIAGATMGGGGVGLGAMAAAQAVRSPFVAGLGTAIRGGLDKAIDPLLSRTSRMAPGASQLIGSEMTSKRRSLITQFIDSRKQSVYR